MPDWLIERGIGETRAALVQDGEIIEAQIELEGTIPAGSVLKVRVADNGTNGRGAVAIAEGGVEFLLPKGAAGVSQGATLSIEVTRVSIPGIEPWKRPLGRATDRPVGLAPALADRLGGRDLVFPCVNDELAQAGWDDLIEEARLGAITFAGGELRVSATPAMILIDVDGYLAPDELAILGAAEAARAVQRLDIGGSIGIDLPTAGSRSARLKAAEALDGSLRTPFERTAVNGFGFVQIVRPRMRPSLVELAKDRAAFEARALLRRAACETAGPKRLVANPAVILVLENKSAWINALEAQVGGTVRLRGDASLPMSAGYAETV